MTKGFFFCEWLDSYNKLNYFNVICQHIMSGIQVSKAKKTIPKIMNIAGMYVALKFWTYGVCPIHYTQI
jgi:hypothetical protein